MTSRWFRFLVINFVLLTLVACHNANDVVVVEINESGRYTLISSDLEREYYVSLPSNYDPNGEALPLLIALQCEVRLPWTR